MFISPSDILFVIFGLQGTSAAAQALLSTTSTTTTRPNAPIPSTNSGPPNNVASGPQATTVQQQNDQAGGQGRGIAVPVHNVVEGQHEWLWSHVNIKASEFMQLQRALEKHMQHCIEDAVMCAKCGRVTLGGESSKAWPYVELESLGVTPCSSVHLTPAGREFPHNSVMIRQQVSTTYFMCCPTCIKHPNLYKVLHCGAFDIFHANYRKKLLGTYWPYMLPYSLLNPIVTFYPGVMASAYPG